MKAVATRRAAFIEEAILEVGNGLFQHFFIKAVENAGMWLWRTRPWRRKPKNIVLRAGFSGGMSGQLTVELAVQKPGNDTERN